MDSIISICKKIKKLPKKEKRIFNRIFSVVEHVGVMKIPKEMAPWVRKKFGPIKEVEKQKIINITNLITFQGALFNELRAKRPRQVSPKNDFEKIIMNTMGDSFCNPKTATPSDITGRMKGKYGIVSSNIAKYDGYHSIVIFKEHHPHAFTEKQLVDYLTLAYNWCLKVNRIDKEANYPFVLWNCLWKAGASIVHGHMQMVVGKECHYAKIELLKKVAAQYEKEHGSEYFQDVFLVHEKLGLGFRKGNAKVFVSLTPAKEKETVIISPEFDAQTKRLLYRIARCFIDRLGVASFNVGIQFPAIKKSGYWKKMPIVISIIDRGNLSNNTSDIGGMELYADNVIETDPYHVFKELKKIV